MPRHSFTRRFHLVYLLLFCGLLPLGPADAAEPWDAPAFAAPAADVLAAAGEIEAPDDAPVHVLLYETEYTVEETGLTRSRERQLYHVVTPAGAEGWATVETAWSPWYQQRPRITARVITAAGRVHELDPATVGEAPGEVEDPDLFHDRRVLRAPLPAVAPGAVVELEIEIDHLQPYFPAGETRRQWLAMGVPIHVARLILDAPKDLALRFHTAEIPEPAVRQAGERVRRVFEHRAVPALEEIDSGLPPEVPLAPYVAFSTGESWTALARAYSELVDERITGSPLDGFAAAAETAPSQWERIAELLAAVHREVRYTGVQLGDAGIVPRTPAETLARRFGDCKDKAVLLTALLRREGIPAYLALLNAGFGPDVEPELPGLGIFNHAIVYVPGASPLWIDPTDPHTPLGALPLADTDRWALVAAPNTRGLIRTPEARSRDHRVVERRKIFLAEYGEARVVEISEMYGNPAREVRSSWEGVRRDELEESLGGYVEATYGATELTLFEHSSLTDPTPPLTVHLEAEDAAYAVTDLSQAVAILPVHGLFQRLPSAFTEDPEGAEEREHDFLIFEPHQVSWTYELHLPEALELREAPEDAEHLWGPLRYSRRFETSTDGRRVTAAFELDTGTRRYTPEDVSAVRRGLAELDELQNGILMVWLDQTVQAHLNAGHVREALAEARRLGEVHPDEGLHRVQLASALLAGGLGAEARRETARAVELDPESAITWAMRGQILAHDEVGRHFVEGFDRKGAEEAYRRALELDPSWAENAAELAVLLEHDEQGQRYSKGSDLDEAIEMYRSVQEDLDDSELARNQVFALFWAERFDEVEEEIERLGSPDELLFLELVAKAVRDGADAALAESSRRLSDPRKRLETLAQTGLHLMLTRHYPEAEAVYRAASRLSPEPARLLSLADLLRRTKRTQPAAPSFQDPEALVRSLFDWILAEDADPAAAVELFSEPLRRAMTDDDLEALGPVAAAVRRELEATGLSAESARDLTLSAMELRNEGQPDLGYRVTLRTDTIAGDLNGRFFAVREGDRYRLAGSRDDPSLLALEVRRRLAAGDLEGAAQWLSWAVEEQFEGRSEDPLSGDAGPRFWSEDSPPEPQRLRLAAAALLADGEAVDEEAVKILETGLEETTDADPTDLELALFQAYLHLGDERAVEIAERLLDRHPESGMALIHLYGAADNFDRRDVARRRLDERLEADPGDERARELRAELAQQEEDFALARKLLDELIREGADSIIPGNIYNAASWLAAVEGRVDETAISQARRGAEETGYRSYSVLHTLATVLAQDGQAAEAYQVLLQALNVAGRGPDVPDWYVLGLLAELYDLPDAARGYYARAIEAAGDDSSPISSAALAQKGLARLGARTRAAAVR